MHQTRKRDFSHKANWMYVVFIELWIIELQRHKQLLPCQERLIYSIIYIYTVICTGRFGFYVENPKRVLTNKLTRDWFNLWNSWNSREHVNWNHQLRPLLTTTKCYELLFLLQPYCILVRKHKLSEFVVPRSSALCNRYQWVVIAVLLHPSFLVNFSISKNYKIILYTKELMQNVSLAGQVSQSIMVATTQSIMV